HTAITPVIVCPGHAQVIALGPEYIMPQDGHAKQDCEQAAGKRWLTHHAATLVPHHVTLLGDDLYSKAPFCALALQQGFNFILVCKPDSHPKLYERLAFWQAQGAITQCAQRRRQGRVTEVAIYRFINDVLLQGGKHALVVNWVEMTVVNAKTGAQLSYNTFITNHRLSMANVAQVAQAGRGRWKIENENNNVLKTKGYHLEHNFGHGKQYLSATMLSLNLLAFLFHTVLEWSDARYALLRQVLARRQTFFEDLRALTRYMVFESWQHLMDCMIQGLKLESKLALKLRSALDTS
ncbi:MAG TPA: ISNCY family transposase, partial [Candidatus Tectomicrobia bacterium]